MSLIDRSESIRVGYQRLRQYARYSIGGMLGSVPASRGSYKFLIDLGESKLFHRSELNAIVKILVDKGVMTHADWEKTLEAELALANKDQASAWPDIKVAENGGSFTLDVARSNARMREEEWPP